MTYIEGLVIPVPADRKADYLKSAREAAPLFRAEGALEIVECWADDVPHGEATDFYRAVGASEGETVVFSWVVWPSREVRDAGNAKLMGHPLLQPGPHVPFDMKRMIYGGFRPVFHDGEQAGIEVDERELA